MMTSPFTVHPQVEALTNPPPFSTVAAPKPIIEQSHIILGVDGTFYMFPFFPTEIRLKIWKANLRPQMLHIIYDVTLERDTRNTYMNGYQYRAAWRFNTSPAMQMPNRFICQESRAEAEKAGYQLLRLRDDLTEARWYNHKIDSLFFDTNANTQAAFASWNEEHYTNYIDNVLPPVRHPIDGAAGL
ncbi:hypothetical protein N431DRAFT_433186 [Stipitochalara longipes BDJ]|nr:hypothetical protein N431DRAFT_433186 [Stipitochalara longipes BDJ]